MINRITIENFKSLRRVDLSLGSMNLLIGTNASGKSNFLDALRVLQGIGDGFTIGEILDGKPRSATSEVWDGIRGGSTQACFTGTGDQDEVNLTVSGTLEGSSRRRWEFGIGFSPAEGRVTRERLKGTKAIYDSDPITINSPSSPIFWVRHYPGRQGRPPEPSFDSVRPAIGQLADRLTEFSKSHRNLAADVTEFLASTQRIDPTPQVLQQYSSAHRVLRLGDRGENFAALVRTICEDERAKSGYLSWLQALRPDEVDDVGTLSGAVDEPLFMLIERGEKFPAPVLSDGTLRFAAIAAAFFQRAMPGIMTIEEVENGIHASRLRLLLELLRSQSKLRGTQVFATTHSPTTLEWLDRSEYRTTFLCTRDESTGESTIRPLTDVPHFTDVIKKAPLSDLFVEGWLESAP
ncbi:MAG: AAA family ATPase [Spirochaetaceae bacterium]|nr:AAA family ATPase [Spirochaetaceae bacterium]